jgi:hypothetical protein
MTDALTPPPAGRARTNRPRSPRPKGTGGVVALGDGVWRVDVEINRDPVTGRRRRVSRRVRGTREDAEVALAKLRVADHQRRLPRPGTAARTVRAALDGYVHDAESGVIELAPKTVVTTRSARNTMCAIELPDAASSATSRCPSSAGQTSKRSTGPFGPVDGARPPYVGMPRCWLAPSIAPESTVSLSTIRPGTRPAPRPFA